MPNVIASNPSPFSGPNHAGRGGEGGRRRPELLRSEQPRPCGAGSRAAEVPGRLPPAADWRAPQHQQHLPTRGGQRASCSHRLRDPRRPPGEPADSPREQLRLRPPSPPPASALLGCGPTGGGPGSPESHVWAGPGRRGPQPQGRARPHPGPRRAAGAAPQPPRRLASCTAGRAGLRPRWADRAWGAPAPRGAPCSAPRAGAASPPPSRRWPATFPA